MARPLKISRGGLISALLIILFAGLGFSKSDSQRLSALLKTNQPGLYDVALVVDGDTIEVEMNGTIERVRFIGVDTPEKNHPEKPVQCFAQAATDHLKDLIGSSEVRLESDPTNQNRDRYNRLLRYVYLPDDTLLNAEQIADGYGFAYTAFPFSKMLEFQALEAQARQQNLGLWGSCDIEQSGGYINTNPSQPG